MVEATTDEIPDKRAQDRREAARLWRWQRNFAPVMAIVVVAVALFFFVVTYLQFQTIERAILAPGNTPTLAAAMQRYEATSPPDDLTYLKWQNLALLDDRAQQSRLARSSAALLVNVWTRYLGFVTGMVLAITGATFIMARLREDATSLEGKTVGSSASLSTSSPGIVLAVLGTALMLAAMTISYSESGEDSTMSAATETADPPAQAVKPFRPKSVGQTVVPAPAAAAP